MPSNGRTTHLLSVTGSVRDWLVRPVLAAPVPAEDLGLAAAGSPWGPEGRWVLTNGPDVTPLKRRLYLARPLSLDASVPEVVEGPGFRRIHTGADGLVDWSEFCFTPFRVVPIKRRPWSLSGRFSAIDPASKPMFLHLPEARHEFGR